MKTFADVKRRLVPGARLECLAHKFGKLVGTVRTIESGKGVLECHLDAPNPYGRPDGDRTFRWELPKARHVRILDAETFEYDLCSPGTDDPNGTVCLRFLP